RYRAVYISKTSKLTGIPQTSIISAVEQQARTNKNRAKKAEQKAFLTPVRDVVNPDAMKLPREEKAERGLICFLYHNPEKLEKLQNAVSGKFVTEFNKRVYDFLVKLCQNGSQPDFSAFNEEFNAYEMGRIREIIGNEMFAYDENAARDFIKVLNDHKENAAKKSPEEMTADDFELLARKLKEKK
ncbi:MAG: hypothetical protein K2J80_01985, partial [Oscillospiraceae bacterium]|nr:hypothetical protein [Oscillospiraceae bacterium]